MKLYFSQTPYENAINPQVPGSLSYTEWAIRTYLKCPWSRHQIVDSPDLADIIIIWEIDQKNEFPFRNKLRNYSLVSDFPENTYVVNFEDGPKPFLPGAYVSFGLNNADLRRVRPIGYPLPVNHSIETAYSTLSTAPTYLFGFSGSPTNPIRRKIYKLGSEYKNCLVKETIRAQLEPVFSGVLTDDYSYAEIILKCKFSLCPKGHSPSSYRIFESMQLGRAPIIISDHWLEPSGPNWREFSIQIGESKIENIPSILEDYEKYHAEMGLLARKAWEKWFSPDVIAHRITEEIVHLHLRKTVSESAFRKENWSKLAGEQTSTKHQRSHLRKLWKQIKGFLSKH